MLTPWQTCRKQTKESHKDKKKAVVPEADLKRVGTAVGGSVVEASGTEATQVTKETTKIRVVRPVILQASLGKEILQS